MRIHWLCKEIGVPVNLIVDANWDTKYIKVKRLCDQVGTIIKILEKVTPWENIVELYIGLLKEAVRKDMHALHSPMALWDYEIERHPLIHNTIPRPLFQNNGVNPHKVNLGEPKDIRNLCVYGWCEWT